MARSGYFREPRVSRRQPAIAWGGTKAEQCCTRTTHRVADQARRRFTGPSWTLKRSLGLRRRHLGGYDRRAEF